MVMIITLSGILLQDSKLRHMYVKYCENKPKSEYIVAEYVDSYFEVCYNYIVVYK